MGRNCRLLSLVLCVLLLVLPSSVVEGKYASSTVMLGGPREMHRWKYLSKFGYDIGTGYWRVRMRTVRPHLTEPVKIPVEVYRLYTAAAHNSKKADYCERSRFRKTSRFIELPANGEWSGWVSGELSQTVRPHVWYFAVLDCGEQLKSTTRIKFEFIAHQQDGSEFSAELRGTRGIVWVQLIISILFTWFFAKECRKFVKSADHLHPVVITLACAIALQLCSTVFELIHLHNYANNGYGVKPLDVLSEICGMLVEVLLSSLLILIALGYTLLHSKLGDLDVVIPIVFIIGVVHVLLVGFGKIKDDASYKFYENEGVVGYILVVIRLLLAAWFLWAVNETRKEAGMKLRYFLAKFAGLGMLYFFSYPVLFIITGLFAPYYRQKVMLIGWFGIKYAVFAWMTSMFLTRGDYFQVSTLNSSFLPGGVRPGLDKEE
ncbi:hypothetical protein FOL47_003976 [Perkinsus chesapeaki]|uniref:GPR180/TMEM145 transmembrane domain-containing protein n=1 Tax=Perkinsus chesapeaki TaxID=330153 RepID=A0A7J6MZB8_PERCH|nr:hypothetical protein FOL47_003976 [Perkinsus chesapeaki]